ncbi:hypothetical protein [Leptolyngbya sp. FACHB-261]|uniref:hypothetical protein n=1 Tax=Leptolyngbya sp. FACHB-261 TaxID=2692806 RepID=UPI001689CEDD|nr:hypothetical protein [Leptolyngbya sp. FACHB-261]MBD2102966.1 hypothetical protein [Leptolyngbya sp. FACHB-261]
MLRKIPELHLSLKLQPPSWGTLAISVIQSSESAAQPELLASPVERLAPRPEITLPQIEPLSPLYFPQ